jgi:hypothetical protein
MNDQAQAWRDLAASFGIEVVAPCEVRLHGGDRILAMAHLKEFGAVNGMIIDPDFAVLRPHTSALIANGYGFSVVELKEHWNRAEVIEMLIDWGWSSPHPRPQWLPDLKD